MLRRNKIEENVAGLWLYRNFIGRKFSSLLVSSAVFLCLWLSKICKFDKRHYRGTRRHLVSPTMGTTVKRKLEMSRAMITANNTSHLKRKIELSDALAAANDMVDEPPKHSLPHSLVSSRKKRVTVPPSKAFSDSSSLTRQTIMNDNTRDAREPFDRILGRGSEQNFHNCIWVY